jgi:hypothetical protein
MLTITVLGLLFKPGRLQNSRSASACELQPRIHTSVGPEPWVYLKTYVITFFLKENTLLS